MQILFRKIHNTGDLSALVCYTLCEVLGIPSGERGSLPSQRNDGVRSYQV